MDLQGILTEFLTVKSDPYSRAREWQVTHQGRVIAHLLPDVPEEIIHAAGALPLAVLGLDRNVSLADSHIPSFICPFIRNSFEIALHGELDFIDGMVIPYVCDSTRAFSHVWEAKFPDLFNHILWNAFTGIFYRDFQIVRLTQLYFATYFTILRCKFKRI